MIQKQHWSDIDRIIITDETNDASVQLDIFHKDDEKRHEVFKADCLLWALWVGKPFRRNGAAKRLMEVAESYARTFGCESVALEYDRRDSKHWVFRWYERLGYEEKAFGRYNSLLVKQLTKEERQ